MKETKAFYKTSEFWLMVLGQIVLTLQTSGAIDIVNKSHAWWAPVLQAVLASAYILARGQAKSGVPTGTNDEALPEPNYESVQPGTNIQTN